VTTEARTTPAHGRGISAQILADRCAAPSVEDAVGPVRVRRARPGRSEESANGSPSRQPIFGGNLGCRPTTTRIPGGCRTWEAAARADATLTDPSPGGGRLARSARVGNPSDLGDEVVRPDPHPPADQGRRQEGTDRGDAARLSASRTSEGVNSVAGNGSTPPGVIPGRKTSETRRTSDRQRGATNPRSPGGASRQGSAKLRRRNESGRVAPFARRSRESGSGSGHRGRCRWG